MECLSIFDIFKIGVGPSSSHTLGPWKAANQFALQLKNLSLQALEVQLFGSLSKTGIGHGTDIAVMMGLMGHDPETVATHLIPVFMDEIRLSGQIQINGMKVAFSPHQDIVFQAHSLPFHPNALTFKAFLQDGKVIEDTYYSVGGGFIQKEGEELAQGHWVDVPYPVGSGLDVLRYCDENDLPISEIVYANEMAMHSANYIEERVHKIWSTMAMCAFHGCHKDGILPGGLNVKRRAKKLNAKYLDGKDAPDLESWLALIRASEQDFTRINRWVSCFALAINEENASLSRVVTSPTNGAAGVIPAVLLYNYCFGTNHEAEDIQRFMLTAGLIGSLFKQGATISAAQGGCQAEIGVSSAMAAAGLTEIQGGTPRQVLMAAEIAMEHHLGLTCDPVGGLVQVPCIERNAMGAIKAITASNLALDSDPEHAIVHLDTVIKTMWNTAQDMHHHYKETAEGGLAIHIPVVVPEC